jgi:hypothetical protein
MKHGTDLKGSAQIIGQEAVGSERIHRGIRRINQDYS